MLVNCEHSLMRSTLWGAIVGVATVCASHVWVGLCRCIKSFMTVLTLYRNIILCSHMTHIVQVSIHKQLYCYAVTVSLTIVTIVATCFLYDNNDHIENISKIIPFQLTFNTFIAYIITSAVKTFGKNLVIN